jgi:ABC-type uncharacterized transport system permease subunit
MTVALFWAVALLYGAAAVLFFAFIMIDAGIRGTAAKALPWARRAIAAGFVVQLAEIGARGVAGLHPVSSVREVIGFLSWVAVGLYLFFDRKRTLDAVGAIVAPGALILLLAARLTPAADTSTVGLGVIGRIHILLASFGIATFAVAAASAILYLLEDRQLKKRKLTQLVKKGAALETLDGIALLCVKIGFPFFTVALVCGVIWSTELSAELRPEHVIAGVAWVAFALVLVARVTAGWRGRRAAVITLFGFAATLVVLGVYLVRGV